MENIEKRIKELEEEIRKTPKNKATEKHLALLKAKLARLREERERVRAKSKRFSGISIKKQGDATIALIGFEGVGKSTLLRKLTDAEVNSYSTSNPQIGMMEYNYARIQVIEIPGIKRGYSKERVREALSFARVADLILLIFDPSTAFEKQKIENILAEFNFRLNKEKPLITIEKKASGGLIINKSRACKLSVEEIKSLLKGLGLHNGIITINCDATEEDIIDSFFRNRVYVPAMRILNKADLLPAEELKEIKEFFPISAEKGINLEELKRKIWEILGLKRIYLKPKGREIEEKPLIVRGNPTLREISKRIFGREAKKGFLIKEKGIRREVSLDYKPKDGEIVEFKI